MRGLGISADAIAARVKGIDLLEISRLKFGLLPVFISRKPLEAHHILADPRFCFVCDGLAKLLETLFAMSSE